MSLICQLFGLHDFKYGDIQTERVRIPCYGDGVRRFCIMTCARCGLKKEKKLSETLDPSGSRYITTVEDVAALSSKEFDRVMAKVKGGE